MVIFTTWQRLYHQSTCRYDFRIVEGKMPAKKTNIMEIFDLFRVFWETEFRGFYFFLLCEQQQGRRAWWRHEWAQHGWRKMTSQTPPWAHIMSNVRLLFFHNFLHCQQTVQKQSSETKYNKKCTTINVLHLFLAMWPILKFSLGFYWSSSQWIYW